VGIDVKLFSFFKLGARWGVSGQRHALAALPPGKKRYPLHRRLGGPQGRSGRVQKISPESDFEPRAVQAVARRYTACHINIALRNTGAE
jgi:hypothetical protein